MNVVIIPGFMGSPEETTFKELSEMLAGVNRIIVNFIC